MQTEVFSLCPRCQHRPSTRTSSAELNHWKSNVLQWIVRKGPTTPLEVGSESWQGTARYTSHALVSALRVNIRPLKAFSLRTKVEIKATIGIARILTRAVQARSSHNNMHLSIGPTIGVGLSDRAEIILRYKWILRRKLDLWTITWAIRTRLGSISRLRHRQLAADPDRQRELSQRNCQSQRSKLAKNAPITRISRI